MHDVTVMTKKQIQFNSKTALNNSTLCSPFQELWLCASLQNFHWRENRLKCVFYNVKCGSEIMLTEQPFDVWPCNKRNIYAMNHVESRVRPLARLFRSSSQDARTTRKQDVYRVMSAENSFSHSQFKDQQGSNILARTKRNKTSTEVSISQM